MKNTYYFSEDEKSTAREFCVGTYNGQTWVMLDYTKYAYLTNEQLISLANDLLNRAGVNLKVVKETQIVETFRAEFTD